jgi:hypothetical protein
MTGDPETLELTPLQKARADLLQKDIRIAMLEATVADREARLMSLELSARETALVAEFKETLQADADARFDWARYAFMPRASTGELV